MQERREGRGEGRPVDILVMPEGEVRRRSGGERELSTAKAVQGVVLSLYFAFACLSSLLTLASLPRCSNSRVRACGHGVSLLQRPFYQRLTLVQLRGFVFSLHVRLAILSLGS